MTTGVYPQGCSQRFFGGKGKKNEVKFYDFQLLTEQWKMSQLSNFPRDGRLFTLKNE